MSDQNPTQGELLPEGKLYYRIGEVSRITGVKPHVLRYWETEFRWMAPPKSRSKQRLYRRKDIDMVLAIKRLLYEERYTIAGARQVIREMGVPRLLEGRGPVGDQVESIEAVEAHEATPAVEDVDLAEQVRAIRRQVLSLRAMFA
jgi:DNA-binding transcriptional MerR regulator